MVGTLDRVLKACGKIDHRFSLVPEGKKRTIEFYEYDGFDKIIMGTIIVYGRSIIVNDGHDNSLRKDLEKYGIRTR